MNQTLLESGKIFLNSIGEFIFPKICIVSENKLSENNSNDFISDDIIQSLDRLNVNDISDIKLKISNKETFSLYSFKSDSDMQKIIHHFKYAGFSDIGKLFGEILSKEILKSDINIKDYDFICPVPLFKSKKRSRGYNQSEILSDTISKELNKIHIPDLLKRTRDTKSQTGMNMEERKENVKNVFELNKSYNIKRQNIILVDDVITTGSTVSECLKALKKRGADRILVISLAAAK